MASLDIDAATSPSVSPARRTKSTTKNSSMEDSSDSEGEIEPSKAFHRRVSTSKQIKHKVKNCCISVCCLSLSVVICLLYWICTASGKGKRGGYAGFGDIFLPKLLPTPWTNILLNCKLWRQTREYIYAFG